MNIRLYVDGGARGNPGPAAIAYMLVDEKGLVIKGYKEIIGLATNNIAEYKALIAGLNAAISLSIDDLDVYSDSELMIKQMTGEYKVKKSHLKQFHKEVTRLANQIRTVTYIHIPRKDNTQADQLVNDALNHNKIMISDPGYELPGEGRSQKW